MRPEVRLVLSFFLQLVVLRVVDSLEGSFLVTSCKITTDPQNRASVITGVLFL